MLLKRHSETLTNPLRTSLNIIDDISEVEKNLRYTMTIR